MRRALSRRNRRGRRRKRRKEKGQGRKEKGGGRSKAEEGGTRMEGVEEERRRRRWSMREEKEDVFWVQLDLDEGSLQRDGTARVNRVVCGRRGQRLDQRLSLSSQPKIAKV